MKYTTQQLDQIQQLASIYLKPTEMAIRLGVPELEFKQDIKTPDHPARIAYINGKLSQKIEVQTQMATLARVGSPLALEMSKNALLDMEDDEL